MTQLINIHHARQTQLEINPIPFINELSVNYKIPYIDPETVHVVNIGEEQLDHYPIDLFQTDSKAKSLILIFKTSPCTEEDKLAPLRYVSKTSKFMSNLFRMRNLLSYDHIITYGHISQSSYFYADIGIELSADGELVHFRHMPRNTDRDDASFS